MIALDPELERVLQQVMNLAGQDAAGVEPDLADNLSREVAAAVAQQETLGQPTVLLVPDRLRLPLARLLRRGVPGVAGPGAQRNTRCADDPRQCDGGR